MALKIPFKRANEGSLIVVEGKLDGGKLLLAFDTGATHTILDLTAVLLAGYSFKQIKRTAQFVAASGIVEAQIFVIENFSAMGIERRNFEVSVYDFMSHKFVLDIDGVIGLDFFDDEKVCIDFEKQELTVHL